MREIARTRNKEAFYPTTLTYVVDDINATLPLEMEVRGNSRLRKYVCRFQPPKLNFEKSEMHGTLFLTVTSWTHSGIALGCSLF
ncbi:MAG: hypothetical protein CBB94_05265 [Gammaproteobacteria bacterium TMED34]|nr:MAG: hypothetical protein CBB94_05265 [Gammaproteobacteria bacterium TMED34]